MRSNVRCPTAAMVLASASIESANVSLIDPMESETSPCRSTKETAPSTMRNRSSCTPTGRAEGSDVISSSGSGSGSAGVSTMRSSRLDVPSSATTMAIRGRRMATSPICTSRLAMSGQMPTDTTTRSIEMIGSSLSAGSFSITMPETSTPILGNSASPTSPIRTGRLTKSAACS